MLELFTQFAAESTGETEGGIAALGIDPLAILLQAGTFLLLFLLIKRYALDKINDTLADREKTIEEGIENARMAEAMSQEAVAKQEELLRKARKESDEIIAKAHEEAGAMVRDAETKASAKSEQLLEDARSQISSEISSARDELKKEVISLVAEASTIVLGEKVDAKKDEDIIKKAIVKGGRS